MNRELKKAVIASNWKMNKNSEETKAPLTEVAPLVKDVAYKAVAYVPFINLPTAVRAAKGANIRIDAQNCHWERDDASTGEIAANMPTFIGVSYIIIGHGGRRTYFDETDQTVNQRIHAALDAGLSVILCVDETLEQREQGVTKELAALQAKIALLGVTKEELTRVTIAYEPIQAIGTNCTATSAQAGEVCGAIRSAIVALYDKQIADAFTVQYGDSVNTKNTAELLAQGDVGGDLISGTSLKVADFTEIIRTASKG